MDLKNYQAKQPFSQKHLLTLADYSQDEILQILSLSLDLKEKTKREFPIPSLPGRRWP